MVEADSIDAVDDILRYNKLTVLAVKPFLATEDRVRNFFSSIFAGIRAKDKAIFSRQLATMINAGLPLMEALRSLVRQTTNKNLVKVIIKIISLIEQGKSFSFAIGQFPYVFSPVFISMIRSGEASGKLDGALNDVADQMEGDYAMRSKIKAAMIYPIFIIGAIGAVGLVAIVYVIPQLEDVFKSSGAQLPVLTRLMVALSHFLVSYWYLTIVIIIVTVLLIRYFMLTTTGKHTIGWIALKFPVFGKINLGIYTAHFAKNLGLLMGGGVPIIKSLSMISESVGNILIEQEIKGSIAEVERGVPLSVPISRSHYFPPLVASMIAVGEQTGQLDKILLKLASIYEDETNTAIKGLTALLEPMIMLIIGLGVMFLVLAILMPIFQLSNVIT